LPKALSLPALYPIVDVDVATRAGSGPLELAGSYLAGGARLLQLRAKCMDGAAFLHLARQMVRLTREAGARLIINDRADIAMLAGADGVHVGQDDLAPADVRRITGNEAIVGLSTHSVDQVRAAIREPVSYIAVGPIFGTQTKATGYSPVGLDLIRAAAELATPLGVPVVAIGGITRERGVDVWHAGAASAAVITDLMGDDPAARVAEFVELAAAR
jgi:thiamine-phosphate pyrophosphorylase